MHNITEIIQIIEKCKIDDIINQIDDMGAGIRGLLDGQ